MERWLPRSRRAVVDRELDVLAAFPVVGAQLAEAAEGDGLEAPVPGALEGAAKAPRFRDRRQAASIDQRVTGGEAGKTAEVPVCGPELRYSVGTAKRSNPRIVHRRAADPSGQKLRLQFGPVRTGFREQAYRRGSEPGLDLVQCLRHCGRRVVNRRMGGNADELVHARPWQPPGRTPFRKPPDAGPGRLVPVRIGAVGVDQNVGIDRDQLPRPA